MTFRLILMVFALYLLPQLGMTQTNLPAADLKTLDGQNTSLQEAVKKGQITVLSFWATWCTPCKRELDEIKTIYADWQADYNVELIAISIDDARTTPKVKAMVEQKKWPYTILTDSNQNLLKALNFQVVPQTFLIDAKGEIVWSHSGYAPGDEVELEEQIKLLAGKK